MAMSTLSTTTLHVEQDSPHTTLVYLRSEIYEPGWNEVVLSVVESAFAGSDICLITFDPPVWDIDLAEISTNVIKLVHNEENFALAFIPAVTSSTLRTIIASSDFQLGVLLITKFQPEDSIRIKQFLTAMLQRRPLEHLLTDEEYIECIDNTHLYWLNSSPGSKSHSIEQLRLLAAHHNWLIEITTNN